MFKREDLPPTPLERVIQTSAAQIEGLDLHSEEATTAVANVRTLCEAQAALWAAQKPRGVSKDVLAPVVGNLLGIGAILFHERANVITTKAMGLIIKPKA
jgi:hypothetical protein